MLFLPYLWQGIELEDIFVDVAGRTKFTWIAGALFLPGSRRDLCRCGWKD